MPLLSEKTAWTLAASGAAILGAAAARRALQTAWRGMADRDPPDNPADPDVSWAEAIAWTALAGAVVGVARMLATRAASSGWQRATGRTPPA